MAQQLYVDTILPTHIYLIPSVGALLETLVQLQVCQQRLLDEEPP